MATTYTLIASNTLSSNTATVTFSSIPNTYTDLLLKYSIRNDFADVFGNLIVRFNSDTATNYSLIDIESNGSTVVTNLYTNVTNATLYKSNNGSTSTSSTFTNGEIYIPSYTVSQNKPFSNFSGNENNATAAYLATHAALWRNTAAISTITLTNNNSANFVTNSSFYLYGIKNS